jgi:hypothetical protein
MDTPVLTVINELARARTSFFNLPFVVHTDDGTLANQFFTSEANYLRILTRIVHDRSTPITISFPIPANFGEPVIVAPSPEQINAELEPYASSSQQSCAICQDQISSDGVRLRGCRHVYHQACIRTWFGASVRCPVCRRDIRENQEAQTSSASTETSPQQTSQSEEDGMWE